jgi:hypothetical protein
LDESLWLTNPKKSFPFLAALLVHTTLGLDNVKKTISHNLTCYTSPKIGCTMDFNVVPRDALSGVKVNKCQNKHQKMG